MSLTPDAIRKQSESAYGQWCKQWRQHAEIHSKFKMKPLADFRNSGIGKALLLIANGYSFEQNIETIKKYRANVDVMVCDKALGHCIENDIIPDFVILCDANVSYEKYLKKWKSKLKNTILFSNVCANPQWTKKHIWKDIYFFVNQDVLKSELEFSKISGCQNFIPAATNVSNAMVVFATQATNEVRDNFFGYDKILMIGFDYSWMPDGNYYAFDHDGNGKRKYMKHVYLLNVGGRYSYTSTNLLFSAKWIEDYIRIFGIRAVQCSDNSVLTGWKRGKLDEQMQYLYKPEDSGKMTGLIAEHEQVLLKLNKIKNDIHGINKDHYMKMVASL